MRLSTNPNNELKRTALFNEHKKLNAKIVPFAGYEMPLKYSTPEAEHLAVRNSAGVFDVSHMGEIFVKGKDALNFVNYLLTNKITTVKRATYTTMCNKNAGIVDDLLVYTIDDEEYLLVVNASNIEKDYKWIQNLAKEYGFNGSIINESLEYSQIAIQGPKSSEFMEKAFGTDLKNQLSEIKFFRYAYINIDKTNYLISRTGYTGEFGYEIYGKSNMDKIFAKLVSVGVVPCGLASRDSLRLEASLPLYGNDLDNETSPLEAGLDFVVKLDKENFVGKDILLTQKNNTNKKLIGFKIKTDERKPIPRHGYKIMDSEQNEIGTVSSGGFSYLLQEPIAMAYIKNNNFENINVDIRNKLYPIEILELPFIKKNK